MPLILDYCQSGTAYSDFNVIEESEKLIPLAKSTQTTSLEVSTENILNAFRLLVVKQILYPSNVHFKHDGLIIFLDSFGAYRNISTKFDLNTKILEDIMHNAFEQLE